ncbi:MAG: PhnD/SsuA/transferrin family substrate-binding protein, partial [Pseudomonadota bacterium]
YWSIMVTHKDSGLTYEDVMKCDGSIDFGIGDPNSTSGFLVPTTFVFAAEGVDPKACFKTVRNANHESNLISVATQQVDAAVANNVALYQRLAGQKPELASEIVEIWRSPLIASDPMAWRPEIDAALKAKIHFFFMSYGRLGTDEEVAAARENLALLGMGPMVPSSNAQLWPFREMEVNREVLRIQGDETMTDAEKEVAVAEQEELLVQIRAAAAARPRK